MPAVRPATVLAWVAGGVLAWMAVPGPHLYDAPGLVAGAWDLAATYPPGQPLHAVLGHAVATALPLGPIAWRVALVSVAGEVLAAWLTGLLAVELLARDVPTRWRRATHAAAMVGALLAPPLIRQALRVEVYGPALCATVASFVALVRWSRGGAGSERWLRAGALAAGLAVALHPPHAFAAVLWGFAVAVVTRRDLFRRPRALGWATLAFLAGASVLVLLPVRELAGALQWGEATTLDGFVRYVTGAPYHHNLGSSGDESVLGGASYVALAAGPMAWLGVALWALYAVRRSDDRAPLLWPLLGCALLLLPAMLQPMDARVPDRTAYAAPAVVALIALAAAALASCSDRRILCGTGLALVALHPAALPELPSSLDIRTQAFETLASSFVDAPPPRALVMPTSDFGTMGWRMARSTEEARPDVAVLPTGTIAERWQWRATSAHPVMAGWVPDSLSGSREALVAMAVERAGGQVPIASEKIHPSLGAIQPLGPYVVAGATVVPEGRSWSVALREAVPFLHQTGGDAGAVGAMFRNVAINRARRLMDADRPTGSLAIHRRLTAWLPPAQRRLVPERAEHQIDGAIAVAHDPDALFAASLEDTVREASAALWDVGRSGNARELLEAQAERGDPLALVQLGWLALGDGHPAAARRALEAFERAAPARRDESTALRRALASLR